MTSARTDGAAMQVPSDFGVSEADLSEMVVPNDLRAAKHPEECIMRELARYKYGRECCFAVRLAIEEALTNAIKHGNNNDSAKSLCIWFHVSEKRVVVGVADEGSGFTPKAVPDPTADENLERPNGRGIMLMQAYMTKVCYNQTGNEVWLLKRNTPPGRTPDSSKRPKR